MRYHRAEVAKDIRMQFGCPDLAPVANRDLATHGRLPHRGARRRVPGRRLAVALVAAVSFLSACESRVPTAPAVAAPPQALVAPAAGDVNADTISGDFDSFNQPSAANCSPLPYGALYSDSIAVIAEVDQCTFVAAQGDVVLLRIASTGPIAGCWNPGIELYDPANALISFAYPSGCNATTALSVTLASGGSHTIQVKDGGNNATGRYNFTLQRLSSPTGKGIAYGGLRSDSIVALAQMGRFVFSGAQNDVALIRIASTGAISGCWNPGIDLYDAAGTLVQSAYPSCNAPTGFTITLPSTGTYLVAVSDHSSDGTGRYNLTLQRLSNPTGKNAAYGALGSDSISKIAQMNRYVFSGTQNDVALLRIASTGAISGCWNPGIELYDAAGALVQSAYPSCNAPTGFTITLPTTGTYLIAVSDHNSDGTGRYNLTLQRLSNPSGRAITTGDLVSDSVTKIAQMRRYVFFDAPSSVVLVRIASTGAISGCWNPGIELYDAAGTLLQSAYPSCNAPTGFTITLPSAGTYLIAVSDHNSDGTGRYNLTLQRLSNPTGKGTAYGALGSDSISKITQMNRYVFAGTQNDVALLRIASTGAISGCWNPGIELYDAAGTLVKSAYPSCNAPTGFTITLPATGTYLIAVSDHNSDATGRYNLTLQRLSNPTGRGIAYGGIRSDSIAAIAQMGRFVFSGLQNDVALIRIASTGAISGCWNPGIELYDAAGTLVQSAYPSCNAPTGFTITLPATGTYLIAVSDHNSDATGRYNLTLQRLSNPTGTAITYGQTLSDSIPVITQMGRFVFNGSQGNAITVTVASTGPISGCWNPGIELYDNAGTLVRSAYPSGCNPTTGFSLALPGTGTYLIAVSDGNSDGTGRYNLTLTSP